MNAHDFRPGDLRGRPGKHPRTRDEHHNRQRRREVAVIANETRFVWVRVRELGGNNRLNFRHVVGPLSASAQDRPDPVDEEVAVEVGLGRDNERDEQKQPGRDVEGSKLPAEPTPPEGGRNCCLVPLPLRERGAALRRRVRGGLILWLRFHPSPARFARCPLPLRERAKHPSLVREGSLEWVVRYQPLCFSGKSNSAGACRYRITTLPNAAPTAPSTTR